MGGTTVAAMLDLSYPTLLAHIRTESQRFRDVLADCDPAVRVPACPDWDASDLLWHLTGVQRFWAGIVRTRPAAPAEVVDPERPTSYDGLLAAFDEHSAALVDALEAADPAEEAWHWSPVQTVGTTFRRQAHEALIHRLDAEQVAGAVTPLDPALAGDGVLEVLEVMYGGEPPAWGRFDASPYSVRVEVADLGESIWVRPGLLTGTEPVSGKVYDGPHLLVVGDPGSPADAVVSGAAADLDAWLWRRRDDAGIVARGDAEAYGAFRAAVDQAID